MSETGKNALTSPAGFLRGWLRQAAGRQPVQARAERQSAGSAEGIAQPLRSGPYQEDRLQTIILEEAYRGVQINEGHRQVTIPMAQAVVRSIAVNAAKGSQRAQRLLHRRSSPRRSGTSA